ncbi:LTA synthase family protein [uncultured Maritalea sp.]|jgi:phosphoglycerol transferase MdoB-like AlkP superfamily enzyme|uniref:LTA synthase family protein n=1 Tax=uncultured Maritalea sp. TaxID=757249 RepID=UPI002606B40D|nr:LTA synthase family protein [uncultured Maritalea sp.]
MTEFTTDKAPMWRYIIFVITSIFALFVLPLALRLSLFDPITTIGFGVADLKGIAIDVALVSALLLIAVWGIPRWGAALAVVLFGLHLLVQVANAEFAWVFGRALEFSQIGYMADQTFFWGSATKLHNPELFFAAIGLVFIVGFAIRGISGSALVRVFSICGLVGWLAFALLPSNDDLADWRTSGFLNQNARSAIAMLKNRFKDDSKADFSTEIMRLKQELSADASGALWLDLPLEKPNILMVVLESASAAYLPSVVETQGLNSNVKMTNVDQFVRKGAVFSQFFAHQRQTTRGTYALLCGQLPRFSSATPKLEVAATRGQELDCLPRRLADAGYVTEYLQAAPLSFSKKDQSLPLTGFQTLYGAASFSAKDIGSAWGVDDHVLFSKAQERVESLSKGEQPWFLTVLNVGTHHPFDIVPSSFAGNDDPKIRSFEYLDVAFGEFVEGLERKGLLANTLVIVVSDESGGLVGPAASAVAELARNWGLFALVAPQWIQPRLIESVAGQTDLPISVADFVGLEPAQNFGGRSAFRQYVKTRTIYAFNSIGNFTYGISNDSIDICQLDEDHCQSFHRVDGKMGDLRQVGTATSMNRKAAALAILTNQGVDDFQLELMPVNSLVEITDDEPYLICCQYIDVQSGSRLTFKAALELTSAAAATVHVDIVSQDEGQFTTHFENNFDLLIDENTPILIEHHFDRAVGDVEVRVRLVDADRPTMFIVHNATLSVIN